MRLQAIANLYKNAVTVDETTGPFDKDGNSIAIDEELVNSEIIRLEQEYQQTRYKRLRQLEYPNLADFADAYYWTQRGDNTKMNEYLAKITEIKEKYPKVTNAS